MADHRRLTTEREQNSRWGPDNGLSCSLWTKTEKHLAGGVLSLTCMAGVPKIARENTRPRGCPRQSARQ